MKLCYDQIEKMKQHLVEHNLEACPICGKEEWAFSDKLYALTEFNPDPDHFECTKVPFIYLVCLNCGNMILFSACLMGIEVCGEGSDGSKTVKQIRREVSR